MNEGKLMGRIVRPNKILFWMGTIIFFGAAILIGLLVSYAAIGRGEPVPLAIFMGSVAGAFGSWAIFFVVLRR